MTTFSFNNNPISDNLANYANFNGPKLLIAKFIIIIKPEINMIITNLIKVIINRINQKFKSTKIINKINNQAFG